MAYLAPHLISDRLYLAPEAPPAAPTLVGSNFSASYTISSYARAELASAYGISDHVTTQLAGDYSIAGFVGSQMTGVYPVSAYVRSQMAGTYSIFAAPSSYARAPAGSGFTPQRNEYQARPAAIQRNTR